VAVPDIGSFHPQIVHFVIALLGVGVVFRIVSLTGKLQFTNHSALTLLLVGTGAAVLAVESGTDAHGAAERVPGARTAVVEHEEWGKRTRNVFLVVIAAELAGFFLPNERAKRIALFASAAVGLGGVFALYEVGEHGGDLVYDYAGGVGIRSGEPEDLEHLLVAGLYHNSVHDRSEGRSEDAARLIAEMVRRTPNDPTIQLLGIESMLVDRHDAEGTLAALQHFSVPSGNRGLQLRADMLEADALYATGQADSAKAMLNALLQEFPGNRRIEAKLAEYR
jgi:uncharacterized membrane protein